MPLLVDTYNVLHVVGVLPPDLAGIETGDLIGLIQQSRYRAQQTQLICDGAPRRSAATGRIGNVTIRYAGGGRSADGAIIAAIAASTHPRRLTVVSSDREILRAARRRRCGTMKSESFLKHLVKDAARADIRAGASSSRHAARPVTPLPRSTVQQWARVFGLSEADLARLAADADQQAKSLVPPLPAPDRPGTRKDVDQRQPARGKSVPPADRKFRADLSRAIEEAHGMVEQPRAHEANPVSASRPRPKSGREKATVRKPREAAMDSLAAMFDDARRMVEDESRGG